MENIFSHYAANESLYTATVSPVCEKHGLTYTEFTVLMFLANNPEFDTASDIIRFRHLTKSHVSMSVKGLEEKGLLKGGYHMPNKRTIHLTVLDAADEIIADGREAQQAFFEILFAGFTEDECNQVSSFINRIDNNISEHIKLLKNTKEITNGKK